MCDSKHDQDELQDKLCSTPNCGFYGRPSTNDLCSQCYKDFMSKKNSATAATSSNSANQANGNGGKSSFTEVIAEVKQNQVENTAAAATVDVIQTPTLIRTKSLSPSIEMNLTTSTKPEITMENSFITPPSISARGISPSLSKSDNMEYMEARYFKEPVKVQESARKGYLPTCTVPEDKVLEVELGFSKKIKKEQKDKRRCFTCNKFLGFTGIECRCEFVFCGAHRYPDRHDCDFDFEENARQRFLKGRSEAAVADKIGANSERL